MDSLGSSVVFSDVFSFLNTILKSDEETEDVALDQGSFVYVEELLHSDLNRLQAEETRLEDASKDFHSSTATLVLENYQVLLEASSQLEAISRDLPDMRKQMQDVLTQYTATEEQARNFWNGAADFGTQRTRSQLQVTQLGFIQDLLEIPALIDRLTKSGLLDEVVDLVYFVEKLSTRGGPEGGKVVQAIAEETRKRTRVVMNLLSHQLRTLPVQLLQALKIVSLERRLGLVMGIKVEDHVRTDFLQSRSIFIGGLVRGVQQRDSYQFLTRVLEICRLHYFDTLNYYLSVFPDSSDLPVDLRTLPYVWLQEELCELCALIEKSLPQIEDNRLEPLYNDCLNFSVALSRFGSNTSTTFCRIFVLHLMDHTSARLSAAISNFKTGITELPVARKLRQPIKSSFTHSKSEDHSKTPDELADFPVVARLHDSINAALNRMRLCSIPSLSVPVISSINQLLQEVATTVNEMAADRKIPVEFENVFNEAFTPGVERMRDTLCPPQEAARVLGVSLHQVSLLLKSQSFKVASISGVVAAK